MKILSRSEAIAKIESTNGKIFSALVRKRTKDKDTGLQDARLYRCRLADGVSKGIKGGSLNFSPAAKGLIMVYLMPGDSGFNSDDASKNRRFIAIEGILNLTVSGVTYAVPENAGAALSA